MGIRAVNGAGSSAEEKISEIFANIVSEGFIPTSVHGASDEEVDSMAAAQGVSHVPTAVRAILRIMGNRAPIWFSGTTFGVNGIDAQVKAEALDCLTETDSDEMIDPQNMLVVAEGGSYSYVAVDGNDLLDPDPPLWLLTESGSVVKQWESTTSWFALRGAAVTNARERLARRRAAGRSDPQRERYFTWNDRSE